MKILKHFLKEFVHKLSKKIKHLLFLEKFDKVDIEDILSKVLLLFIPLFSLTFFFLHYFLD